MAIPKEEPLQKWVFPLQVVIYLAENLSGPKIFYSLSWFPLLIGNYSVFLRSFSFLLSSDLRSGILLCLFFSFFSFLPFHFFLSSFLIFDWNSSFSIRYSLSLEEILLSFPSGGRMRILFMGQGSR